MSDQQFKIILVHLQVLIATTGLQAGIMLAFAWQYL
jgi:hypothetical protein